MTAYPFSCLVFTGVAASTVAMTLLSHRWKNLSEENSKLKENVEKLKQLRSGERQTRINLQQESRRSLVRENTEQLISYKPIGHIQSPFPDRRGTPRQPILVPAARGFVRFNTQIIQAEHFAELSEFSHVWIIFVFHENTNEGKHDLPAKIRPPRLHGKKVGCMSTRSPHRPNNIGLSVCEVVSVGRDFIEIRGLDLVDGTPVIDGELKALFILHLYSII